MNEFLRMVESGNYGIVGMPSGLTPEGLGDFFDGLNIEVHHERLGETVARVYWEDTTFDGIHSGCVSLIETE